MLFAQHTTACGQHLLLQFPRARQIALRFHRCGQIVHRRQRVRMLLAQQISASSQHLLLQFARALQISKQTDQRLTGAVERELKAAATVDELMEALDRRIARNVTADWVSKGALIFQPSAERRRSGSHYTPRSLTSPIVKATLQPVLAQLGANPKPEQILALKV